MGIQPKLPKHSKTTPCITICVTAFFATSNVFFSQIVNLTIAIETGASQSPTANFNGCRTGMLKEKMVKAVKKIVTLIGVHGFLINTETIFVGREPRLPL